MIGVISPRTCADQQFRSFDAAIPLVQMRIGAIGNQSVATIDHQRRQVCVGVQRANDRHPVADQLAQFREPISVGVRESLADRRTVGRDQDSIKRQMVSHGLQQLVDERRERVGGNRSGGQSPRGKQRDGFHARGIQAGKETTDFMMRTGQSVADGGTAEQQILSKRLQRRRLGGESVRFVQQRDDADSHGE